MDLDRFIIATEAELYRPATILCARAGRKLYEPECSRLVLTANQSELAVCLGCPQGRAVAATSPWPVVHPTVVGVDTAPGEDRTAEVLVAQRPNGRRKIMSMRVKHPRQQRASKPDRPSCLSSRPLRPRPSPPASRRICASWPRPWSR